MPLFSLELHKTHRGIFISGSIDTIDAVVKNAPNDSVIYVWQFLAGDAAGEWEIDRYNSFIDHYEPLDDCHTGLIGTHDFTSDPVRCIWIGLVGFWGRLKRKLPDISLSIIPNIGERTTVASSATTHLRGVVGNGTCIFNGIDGQCRLSSMSYHRIRYDTG